MNNQSGITLIEVLLTIGLIGLIGAALVRLGSTALTASDAGRARAVATQLADEGLEAARAKRDQAGSSFFGMSAGNYSYDRGGSGNLEVINTACDPTAFSPHADCAVPNHDGFYRVISIAFPSSDKANVISYVFWNQDGTWSKVVNSTVLTQWR